MSGHSGDSAAGELTRGGLVSRPMMPASTAAPRAYGLGALSSPSDRIECIAAYYRGGAKLNSTVGDDAATWIGRCSRGICSFGFGFGGCRWCRADQRANAAQDGAGGELGTSEGGVGEADGGAHQRDLIAPWSVLVSRSPSQMVAAEPRVLESDDYPRGARAAGPRVPRECRRASSRPRSAYLVPLCSCATQ